MTAPPTLRWTRDPLGIIHRAGALQYAYLSLPRTSPALNEVRQYAEVSLCHLIFESNAMEGAGVSSLSDTRKLVLMGFPGGRLPRKIQPSPTEMRAVRVAWVNTSPKLKDWFAQLKAPTVLSPESEILVTGVRHGTKGRSTLEVVHHVSAALYVQLRALQFQSKRSQWEAARVAIASGKGSEPWRKWARTFDIDPQKVPKPQLVDQGFIKRVHLRLMKNVLDKDQQAGVYRTSPSVRGRLGEDKPYLSPALIRGAMRHWVRETNARALQLKDPIGSAARMSHRFVAIHPFDDGNGRMSRLLLNLSLMGDSLPFFVVPRSTAVWKRRYMESLYAADAHDFLPLTTLIAQRMIDAYEQINKNLSTAGLSEISAQKR